MTGHVRRRGARSWELKFDVGLDATGNRNNGSNTPATGNRFSTDGVWNYSDDAEGNVIAKTNITSGETWNYTYDNENDMISAKDWSGTPGSSTLYRSAFGWMTQSSISRNAV